MSTFTPASFSYACTPAAAIFQNSLALLVTNASFRPEPPPEPPPLVPPPSFLHPLKSDKANAIDPTTATTTPARRLRAAKVVLLVREVVAPRSGPGRQCKPS